ncbi:Myosin-7 [Liparis tanakae]|uniref:Myosin-7 n=1 Tax=Liparis tanakae TaxID=230148 RepID=A0A4Z2GAI6_9TELE|nr:Myosin-7 [Liparis tanakae]
MQIPDQNRNLKNLIGIAIAPHWSTDYQLWEQESGQASEQRCVQLEKTRRELERQLSGRLEEEEVCSAQLTLHRERLEAECSSLRRDLDDLESTLTLAEHDKQLELLKETFSCCELRLFWVDGTKSRDCSGISGTPSPNPVICVIEVS